MPRSLHAVLVSLFVTVSGCVPETPSSARVSVLEARVEDAHGGLWSPGEAPRHPRVTLQLAPKDAALAGRTFWLWGDAEPALLEDLADPPLRQGSERRLLDVTLERTPGGYSVFPDQPLPPGAQTTLVLWQGAGLDADRTFWRLPLQVSSSPAAGASLVATLPPHGAGAVSIATRRLLLRWDGYVEGLAQARAELGDGKGTREVSLQAFDCPTLGLSDGTCAWLQLPPLEPERSYDARIAGALSDATGRALKAPHIQLRTTDRSEPPTVEPPTCAADETPLEVGCGRATHRAFVLRTATRAPALLRLTQGDLSVAAITGSAPVELRLPSGGPGPAILSAEDLTGRVFEAPVQVWLEPDLPRVRMSEVAPAPLGSDAHSEYVEIVNEGEETAELEGFRVARDPDGAGNALAAAAPLPPGGRALLVGPAFEPGTLADLPPGLPRLHAERDLRLPGEGGLLLLRDVRGRRVATLSLPATPDGRCVVSEDAKALPVVGPCRYPEANPP